LRTATMRRTAGSKIVKRLSLEFAGAGSPIRARRMVAAHHCTNSERLGWQACFVALVPDIGRELPILSDRRRRSRHTSQQTASLFDRFVRAREQHRKNVRPSCLAVLRLMTNSYLVGCTTGRSARPLACGRRGIVYRTSLNC
jgi:hypothetical protein